ncbi:MAG: VOC family protein [Lentimicrobiaceae bacterium]|nr:VOC family protein [Lentimicrobiaceae bacterium]
MYISGIQQIGIGTTSLYESWKWYADIFGMNIRILEDDTVAERMLCYTGNQPQKRHAAITINLQGGAGFEIWQYSDRTPQSVSFEIAVGDLGIYCGKVKSKNVKLFHEEILKKYTQISPLYITPDNTPTFYILDPFGNYFQVVEDSYIFSNCKQNNGGCIGAQIGVSNIEKALTLYCDVLGYDTVVYDKTGIFEDFSFMHAGTQQYRRMLLKHSKKRTGAFSEMFGPSQIELVVALERIPKKIYEGRFWGDPGFIQLCFDITNMKAFKRLCEEKGFPFTVDSCPSGETFDMGDAAGHFTYIEDPDGTLIEFVETHKIPIIKKLNLFINLKKRNPSKPLPKIMLKALGFNKVKF